MNILFITKPNLIDVSYMGAMFFSTIFFFGLFISLIVYYKKKESNISLPFIISIVLFLNSILFTFFIVRIINLFFHMNSSYFNFLNQDLFIFVWFIATFFINILFISTIGLRPRTFKLYYEYRDHFTKKKNNKKKHYRNIEDQRKKEFLEREKMRKEEALKYKREQEEAFRKKRAEEAARKRKVLEEAAKKRAKIEKDQKRKKQEIPKSKPFGARRGKQPINAILYGYLNLDIHATQEEIKQSYRQLAKKYHPDVSTDPNAQEKFLKIQRAYQVLSDPKRKLLYDVEGVYTE